MTDPFLSELRVDQPGCWLHGVRIAPARRLTVIVSSYDPSPLLRQAHARTAEPGGRATLLALNWRATDRHKLRHVIGRQWTPEFELRVNSALYHIAGPAPSAVVVRRNQIHFQWLGRVQPIRHLPCDIRKLVECAVYIAMLPADAPRIVVMLEALDARFHPEIQRSLIPNLVAAIAAAAPQAERQILITTTAPMTLAALEPIWDRTQDKLYRIGRDLYEEDGFVAQEMPFIKRGPIDRWVVNLPFDLSGPGSLARSRAIACMVDAVATYHKPPFPPDVRNDLRALLRQHLADDDPFWPHCLAYLDDPERPGENWQRPKLDQETAP